MRHSGIGMERLEVSLFGSVSIIFVLGTASLDLDSLKRFADGQNPFFEVNVSSLQGTKLPNAKSSHLCKCDSESCEVLIRHYDLHQPFFLCFCEQPNLCFLLFRHHKPLQRFDKSLSCFFLIN